MITIHHLSDLHIGPPVLKILPFNIPVIDKTEASISLLQDIRALWNREPDANRYLLITGDITNDGTEAQYQKAREALAPFSGRLLLAPGNHDYGLQGSGFSMACVDRFTTYMSPLMVKPHTFVVKTDGIYKKNVFSLPLNDDRGTNLLVLGLDTCFLTKSVKDWAKGTIGHEQFEQLESIVNSTPSDWNRFIFMHHRPTRCGYPKQAMTIIQQDRDRFMNIARSQAEILAFGHQGLINEDKSLPHQIPPQGIQIRRYQESGQPCPRLRYCLNANASVERRIICRITFTHDTPCLAKLLKF